MTRYNQNKIKLEERKSKNKRVKYNQPSSVDFENVIVFQAPLFDQSPNR